MALSALSGFETWIFTVAPTQIEARIAPKVSIRFILHFHNI